MNKIKRIAFILIIFTVLISSIGYFLIYNDTKDLREAIQQAFLSEEGYTDYFKQFMNEEEFNRFNRSDAYGHEKKLKPD